MTIKTCRSVNTLAWGVGSLHICLNHRVHGLIPVTSIFQEKCMVRTSTHTTHAHMHNLFITIQTNASSQISLTVKYDCGLSSTCKPWDVSWLFYSVGWWVFFVNSWRVWRGLSTEQLQMYRRLEVRYPAWRRIFRTNPQSKCNWHVPVQSATRGLEPSTS